MPLSPRSASRTGTALDALDQLLHVRGARWVLAGLVAVALLVAGAAAAGPPPPRPEHRALRLSAEVHPSPVAVPAVPRVAVAPRAVPSRRPVPHPPGRRAKAQVKVTAKARPKPGVRWLPSGTGMWVHQFAKTQGGDPRAVVRTAQHAGLTTLYVQTGSSRMGWIGSPVLATLLPATRGTALRVVAWDFPVLADPVADAHRLAKAALYRCPGCPRVAAVAPDVETAAEGTRISGPAVARYYRALRSFLPADVAILATVPWPSEQRVGKYPYAETAPLVDALLPMAYWYNRSPAGVTTTSMTYLQRFHKPLMPVGQGFDGRLDAPYLAADPHPGASVQAFLLAARHHGARAVSLWSWQTTGGQQWRALAGAHRMFPRH